MLRLWLLLSFLSSPLAYALDVMDDSGRTVSLDKPAERIVSLAPHLTEQLYAIGAGGQIVGAVEYSDYPEAAKAVPRVGGYSRLDLERVLALKPDLIVGWESGNNPQQLARLQTLGFTVYRSEPRRLDDIPAAMLKLGLLVGRSDEAAEQAAQFRSRVKALRVSPAGREPRRVFYQIWYRPLMTVNGEHLINDVIALCGGENIFAALPSLTPSVSEEAVIAADPHIIIASGMSAERPEWLDDWRQWPQMRAVKDNALYVINPNLIQRATPRLLQGAEAMCQFIKP